MRTVPFACSFKNTGCIQNTKVPSPSTGVVGGNMPAMCVYPFGAAAADSGTLEAHLQ